MFCRAPKTLKCDHPDCSSSATKFNPSSLRHHKTTTHDGDLLKCDFQDCPTVAEGKLYSKANLRSHKAQVHYPRSLECDIPECPTAKEGKKFNETTLRRHMRTHDAKDKECDVPHCFQKVIGHLFSQRGLTMHKDFIHGPRTYYCQEDDCTRKGPYTKLGLDKHIRVHRSPFILCNINGCSYANKHAPSVVKHQAKFHGKFPTRDHETLVDDERDNHNQCLDRDEDEEAWEDAEEDEAVEDDEDDEDEEDIGIIDPLHASSQVSLILLFFLFPSFSSSLSCTTIEQVAKTSIERIFRRLEGKRQEP